jgi:maltose O-acetyltransferase
MFFKEFITKILPDGIRNAIRRFNQLLVLSCPTEIMIESLRRNGMQMGTGCRVLEGVSFDWSHCCHIKIGDDVTFAPGVRILAHDASMKRHLGHTRIGKVEIGNTVFIGANTIVLPNVKIGENSIIAAGSVVTRDIPSNVVAGGNPARIICSLEEFLNKHRKKMRILPCFGREYTVSFPRSQEVREEMNERMSSGEGYIV